MSKQLPKQPSLEHLKNEAKALLRLARSGDPDATSGVGDPKLANAQLRIARNYGFASWAKLKRAVEDYPSQRDALFAAVRAGDGQRAEAVLKSNRQLASSLNPQEFGIPPIVLAAQRNDRPMIELLLRYGADVDGRSDWWAGSFGALDFSDDATSQFLLKKGATLTPHAAARLGMAKELRGILAGNPGAARERGGDGQFPLHFAKAAEIVDILLDAGAEIDARDLDHEGTPAQTRILDSEIVKRLVERGAATDIFLAIAVDDLDLVKRHLSDDPAVLGRRTDQPGNPMIPQAPGSHIYTYNLGFVRPIQAAIKLNRDQIFEYLYDQSPPRLKLISACLRGDRNKLGALLAERSSLVGELSAEERIPLCESARSGDLEAVKLMLEVGFDPNTPDREQMTAAHWAAFHGDAEMLRTVLPYKPDLERRNMYGGTVLSTCLYGSLNGWRKGDYFAAVSVLLRAGASVPEHVHGSAEALAALPR